MWIGLFAYAIFGIVLNFIGPVVNFLSDTIRDLKNPTSYYTNKDNTAPSKKKIVLFEILLRLLVFLFYPIAYAIALID
jgi:hypothetical protein